MAEPSDEVALTIERTEFLHWDQLEVHQGLDSHATVGFVAPFEPDNEEFRKRFEPCKFQECTVDLGTERAFTGRIVEPKPNLKANPRTISITAYSLPAQLEDTDTPVSRVPVEATGMSLRQIAQRLAEPFGVQVVVEGDDGGKFKRVKTRQHRADGKVETDQKIADFLGELARQRGRVMTSDAQGRLLFPEIVKPGSPVVRLEEGQSPLIEVDVALSPREYYSEITGFTNTKRGVLGAKYTERNERLAGGITRALNFRLDDVEKADAPKAVRAKMGRMFGNLVHYTVHLPTWRDPKGKLFKPNTTLTLKAPSAFIYREYELLIRDVFFRESKEEGRTCSLGLVLPGAFTGETPATLPWSP